MEELPLLVAIEPGESTPDPTALGQRCRVRRLVVAASEADLRGGRGHPGIEIGDARAIASKSDADLVWLTNGQDTVAESFLSDAANALAENPEAAFAVGVEAGRAAPPISLVSVLSGTGLGNSVLFRGDAVKSLGGFDEAAPMATLAQWDLCIRLVNEGRSGTSVDGLPAQLRPAFRAGGSRRSAMALSTARGAFQLGTL